ncbi:hypothetical protein AK830_g4647 [Neonectria ditissima]|uniref:Protein kinase domain-containing protein n=1 Tax=Neonectria ditissima TaxID=78410 RepID=A0A0P7BFP5_9HYPO|nr:hypothetical protein AK830_g4647 [Neonectria ditissima]
MKGSSSGAVFDTLLKAHRVLDDLNCLLSSKLLRPDDGIGRARRRTFLLHKDRITSIRDELKDARINLLIALSTQFIAPALKLEQALTVMQQNPAEQQSLGQTAAFGLAQLLKCIQKVDVSVGQVIPTVSAASSLDLHIALPCEERQPSMPCVRGLGRFLENLDAYAMEDLETPADEIFQHTTEERVCDGVCKLKGPAESQNNQLPDPLTSLEKSMSFCPEALTTTDAAPPLFTHMTVQDAATEFSRTNSYAMFYRKAPRQWVRLTVSITFGVESPFWNFEKTPVRVKKEPPSSVAQILAKFLQPKANLQPDTHIQIYSGSRVEVIKSSSQSSAYFRTITSMLHHLRCKRFSEQSLLQVPLHRRQRSFFFVSRLQSQWVLDFRFGSSKSENARLLYQLQALHCLRGAPGICSFLGLVTDQDSSLVKGFLTEMPSKGVLFNIMARSAKSNITIPWEIRERWCRDIVQAVAQAHSGGFTVGKLGCTVGCGIVLGRDCKALLYHFQPFFDCQMTEPARIPPEFQSVDLTGGSFTATPHTDIYQLGLTIWLIATNCHQLSAGEFCKLAGSTCGTEAVCKEPHADPVQLPPLDEAPQYVNKIISACRSENPHQRPAAWELLDMFFEADNCEPSTKLGDGVADTMVLKTKAQERGSIVDAGDSTTLTTRVLGEAPKQLVNLSEKGYELYDTNATCDICRRLTTEHYFVCLVCSSCAYDICPQCLSEGAHCLVPSHYLHEVAVWDIQMRLFSNMKEDRKRVVIAL